MRKASDCHLNDIAVCSDPDSGTPKKKPRFVGGPRYGCGAGFWAESSQPPARVPKSRLWNWFHGPFGCAQ
jgi:hypothetical protein